MAALAVGDVEENKRWIHASADMANAMRTHLFDSERGCFDRMLGDKTIDSATLAWSLFVFMTPDELGVSNARVVENALTVNDGLARYENDYYFRQRDGYTGNPWVITTMWLAQTHILQGDLAAAERALEWVREHQEPTGILAEQYHPDTGAPLSVSPLTWSHAEVVRTIQMLRQARSTLEA